MKIARPSKTIIETAQRRSGKQVHAVSHMIWVASVLIENCTDPQSDTIELSPYLFQQHVAPEQ